MWQKKNGTLKLFISTQSYTIGNYLCDSWVLFLHDLRIIKAQTKLCFARNSSWASHNGCYLACKRVCAEKINVFLSSKHRLQLCAGYLEFMFFWSIVKKTFHNSSSTSENTDFSSERVKNSKPMWMLFNDNEHWIVVGTEKLHSSVNC